MVHIKWDDSLPEKGRQAAKKASTVETEEALKHATQFIDTLPFKGERLTETQSLSWPRKGVYGDDGKPVSGVPAEIKEATAMIAGFILAKAPFDVPAMGWVMLKLGYLLKDEADLRASKITWH